ncbi:MAG: RNase adapter RapZ [Desulfobacterales bacterium]|nr:RNase adapter RapZ [Desulfobacterales bacterium]
MKTLKIVIITGYSGSGKSSAVSAFEDSGYHCVDNMPVALLPKFLELPNANPTDISGLAFVMDLREKGFIDSYRGILDSLRQKGYRFHIIFLEASEEILLRRYSETRRHHPLATGVSLKDSIRTEKKMLAGLRNEASRIIDTSDYNIHKLRSTILAITMEGEKKIPLRINIFSFGFKHGPPRDADLVMDVRFLPNPYFEPKLKAFSGEDPSVREFIFKEPVTSGFMDKYLNLLDYLVPLYEKEGKAYLTIAFGCTGGRHRSVAIARAVYDHMQKYGHPLGINHRDIGS